MDSLWHVLQVFTSSRVQILSHMMWKVPISLLNAIYNQWIPIGTDRGNKFKVDKEVAGYDEDAKDAIDLLMSLPNCNGRIAATGMCLGGHLVRPSFLRLASLSSIDRYPLGVPGTVLSQEDIGTIFSRDFQAAFDPRVKAAVCFFATDIHTATLGHGDDSLEKIKGGVLTGPGKAELTMIFGKQDTHVPRAGRDLIRKTLEDANVACSFLEVQAQHAFIRDES
ncbi:hypothetical protein FRC15_005690, partial [Serendipita sp. 397]